MILNNVRVGNGSGALCIGDEQRRAKLERWGTPEVSGIGGVWLLSGKYLRTISELLVTNQWWTFESQELTTVWSDRQCQTLSWGREVGYNANYMTLVNGTYSVIVRGLPSSNTSDLVTQPSEQHEDSITTPTWNLILWHCEAWWTWSLTSWSHLKFRLLLGTCTSNLKLSTTIYSSVGQMNGQNEGSV